MLSDTATLGARTTIYWPKQQQRDTEHRITVLESDYRALITYISKLISKKTSFDQIILFACKRFHLSEAFLSNVTKTCSQWVNFKNIY